jgi:hypothetical protein
MRTTKGDVKSIHVFHELCVQPVTRREATNKKHALLATMNVSLGTEEAMNLR